MTLEPAFARTLYLGGARNSVWVFASCRLPWPKVTISAIRSIAIQHVEIKLLTRATRNSLPFSTPTTLRNLQVNFWSRVDHPDMKTQLADKKIFFGVEGPEFVMVGSELR